MPPFKSTCTQAISGAPGARLPDHSLTAAAAAASGSSAAMIARAAPSSNGGMSSWRVSSSLASVGPRRSDREARAWPNLTNDGPDFSRRRRSCMVWWQGREAGRRVGDAATRRRGGGGGGGNGRRHRGGGGQNVMLMFVRTARATRQMPSGSPRGRASPPPPPTPARPGRPGSPPAAVRPPC